MGSSHTPTVPAGDDRPLRLIERTPVPQAHRDLLGNLVRRAQEEAQRTGQDLQSEFGKEHVALIVGCNQFLRILWAGDQAGAVEVLLDDPGKAALRQAGFALRDPEGMVFKLFGWARLDPTEGPAAALEGAVAAAYGRALANRKR